MSETAPEALKLGTPEYDAAMAAKFDKSQDPKTFTDTTQDELPAPAMPEGGFEKFYDAKTGAYNWENHAREAEFKLKGGKPAEAKAPEADAKKADAPEADAEAADIVAKAGLTMEGLRQEISTDGKLSDASRDAIIKQGVPEWLVDEYVTLAADRVQAQTTSALDYAGGEDTWNQMSTWAAQNLPEAEKVRVNALLGSADWKTGVDVLKTHMNAAKGTSREGRLQSGVQSGSTGASGFSSRAEQTAAIQSDKYKKDPAFRKEVAARIAASDYSKEYRG